MIRLNKEGASVNKLAITMISAVCVIIWSACKHDDQEIGTRATDANIRACKKLIAHNKSDPGQVRDLECFCTVCGDEIVACEKDARCGTLSRNPERQVERAMKEAVALLEERDSCIEKYCSSRK